MNKKELPFMTALDTIDMIQPKGVGLLILDLCLYL